jgi:hypothetical protein
MVIGRCKVCRYFVNRALYRLESVLVVESRVYIN